MHQENRKKRIPGIHSYLAVIGELRQELGKVNESINDLRDKISAIYKQERENSPKNNLYKKLEELGNEIKALKEDRSKAFNSKNDVVGVYENVKSEIQPEKGKKMMSAQEIDARMKEINLKLISSKCDSKTEKIFEMEMENLRKQKKNIGMMEQKSKLAVDMKAKLDSLNAEIKDLSQKIAERQSVVDGIKAELKEISDQGKPKNPAVEGYEKNIQILKAKRSDLSEKIKAQQEKIREKEVEYDKFLEEMAIAQALEKQKEEIKQRINALEEQKNILSKEESKLNPSKFDSIIFRMGSLNLSGEKISLPVDLALYLSQHKIPIPTSPSQVEPTIETLKSQKENFANQVVEKRKEFESKISDLERKISEEKKTLMEMPPTDIKVLKFKRD
ncbi:uncharacterized protein Eint_111610 [Encephalitozoon intestinalis ATCC 50506]|uniref:Uncharacterized protein n=1 Tax=Encephalitozoon intestinalis (strain ATCC 50506) TaxID=876142 RepID=E0SA38_ENCIT|nr:uncharacterized protein Eint_111610 [Encephalitozoon intestinalis ATCC 50506]ADM12660.1 hypothetical protein Eint_111610 [Encephalitozoon intestinalis ATCC 50506]UTX46520.1 hypothetical protein GPK93_11g21310 [Encephalitozoon intestinalis]